MPGQLGLKDKRDAEIEREGGAHEWLDPNEDQNDIVLRKSNDSSFNLFAEAEAGDTEHVSRRPQPQSKRTTLLGGDLDDPSMIQRIRMLESADSADRSSIPHYLHENLDASEMNLVDEKDSKKQTQQLMIQDKRAVKAQEDANQYKSEAINSSE